MKRVVNPEKLTKAGGFRCLNKGVWEWFFNDVPDDVFLMAREYGTQGDNVLVRFTVEGNKEKVDHLIKSVTESVIL